MPDIEINPQFKKALDLLEGTESNVFITGKAGTGKSTLLDHFRKITQKKVVVLAPTGVAALNVGGETVHSFFRFKPNVTLKKIKKLRTKKNYPNIYKELDTIIIDEVSMVRSDLLDCVDRFMRLNGKEKDKPFGGAQMAFIGDLYQLPPVVTSHEKEIFRSHYKSQYFFDSKVFAEFRMEFVELEKVYRQKDPVFVEVLNAFRNNTVLDEHIELMNSRVKHVTGPEKDFQLYLTTTNAMAEEINIRKLEESGGRETEFEADLSGEIDEKSMPTGKRLRLKENAQVMLLNNDTYGRWVNGSIGKITSIGKNSIVVQFEDGREEIVAPHTWEIFHYSYDAGKGTIQSDVVGDFVQLPVKLAWAITIHKSQGLTFDDVIIDVGRGTFAHGQLYVALSRCRTLNGIILAKPVKKQHVIMDRRVMDFVTKFQYARAEEELPLTEKMGMIRAAIEEKIPLEIVYLKARDERSTRTIMPLEVGEMEYKGVRYTGVSAMCDLRGMVRTFRVDRILEMKRAGSSDQ